MLQGYVSVYSLSFLILPSCLPSTSHSAPQFLNCGFKQSAHTGVAPALKDLGQGRRDR